MTKHAQKITVIVCLLLATITPALQGAQPKYYRAPTPKAWFEAAKAGSKKTLGNLFSSGKADIDAKNELGETALHKSAWGGHLACVKWLVQHGADINAKTDRRQGIIEILTSSFTDNSNYSNTALLCSAKEGHLAIVKYLVQQGADIDGKDGERNTAFMSSAMQGHLEIVKYLAQQDADIESKDRHSRTAFILSAMEGHLAIVKYLVQEGADIHAKNMWGSTALHLSALGGHSYCVKYLLQQGVDFSIENDNRRTALNLARRNKHKVAERLLANPVKCIKEYFKEEMQKRERALAERYEEREANLRAEHEEELMRREMVLNNETEARVTELEATLRAEFQTKIKRQRKAFGTLKKASNKKDKESGVGKINTLKETIENLKTQYKEREANMKLELKSKKIESREHAVQLREIKMTFKERERELIEDFKRREGELTATIKRLTQNEGVSNKKENETPYH